MPVVGTCSPGVPGCTSTACPGDAVPPFGAVAVTVKALFQRAAYSHPSPPMAFFISFWLGIRHVLTEQTFCCPQNPPLRREATTSSLCRCPEPALGWGEPGLGLGQPFKGKAEPFQVASRSGARAWLLLSCRALIAFSFHIPSCETGDATEERCPSPGLWRVLVAQVCCELCISSAHLPVLVTVSFSLRHSLGTGAPRGVGEADEAEDAHEFLPGVCVC